MSQAHLERFVEAINARQYDALNGILATEFHGYVAQGDEPTATDATIDIAKALVGASPDLQLTLADLRDEDGEAKGTMSIKGTYSGSLWSVPGAGQPFEFTATVVARPIDDTVALKWEDAPLIPTLRSLGILPMPEVAHIPPEHPVAPTEMILKLAFNGMKLAEKECSHLDQIKIVEPVTDVCKDCVESGTEWPALRMCLICGYTGCCDLATNHHAKAHAEESGHPIFRSIVPGESWIWCYEDLAFLGSRHLKGRG